MLKHALKLRTLIACFALLTAPSLSHAQTPDICNETVMGLSASNSPEQAISISKSNWFDFINEQFAYTHQGAQLQFRQQKENIRADILFTKTKPPAHPLTKITLKKNQTPEAMAAAVKKGANNPAAFSWQKSPFSTDINATINKYCKDGATSSPNIQCAISDRQASIQARQTIGGKTCILSMLGQFDKFIRELVIQ